VLPLAAFSTLIVRLRRLPVADARFLRRASASTEVAILVAAVSMLLLGLGGWLWWWRSGLAAAGLGDLREVFIKSVLAGSAMAFGLWLAWLVAAYAVLQRLTGVLVPMDRLVREAGIATAPLALSLLMVLPVISFGVGLLAVGLCAASMQSAIGRASGSRGLPVLLANGAGFALWAAVLSLLATSDHMLAPGPFVAETLWEAVATYSQGLPQ
jgi:hypothetical protein